MTDHNQRLLTPEELDTIGEIMNISMGTAATAVSTMIEKQVTITTPSIEQDKFQNIDSSSLEPAVMIKIRYVEGVEGTNIMMFRTRDMQIILNLLMGNDISEFDSDFEFDEMSMSAACEVMNQMMGASSTALSEILERSINISTPEAVLVESKEKKESSFFGLQNDENVVGISFKMMIKGVLDTTFICFLSTDFAFEIVNHVRGPIDEAEEVSVPQELPPVQATAHQAAIPEQETTQIPAQAPFEADQSIFNTAAQQSAPPMSMPELPVMPQQMPVSAPTPFQPPVAPPPAASVPVQTPVPQQAAMPRPPMQFEVAPPQIPVQQPYGAVPNAGYPQAPAANYPPAPRNIQNPEFPDFSKQAFYASKPADSNMNLLMGVQLDVSVVIGRTKRKIKDVMEFGQGTVIELDKQTGSPAEIMVNGQLLAYGDVIVVGDNFGIRITEIVGTKELLNSLDSGI